MQHSCITATMSLKPFGPHLCVSRYAVIVFCETQLCCSNSQIVPMQLTQSLLPLIIWCHIGLVHGSKLMFAVDEVLQLRTGTVSGRSKYAEFLQHYIPSIIGSRKWSGVRQHRLVKECFTYSDEAFLLHQKAV